MSKVIAVNAGSSSLKFQLFKMPEEEVLTSGVAERIGLDEGIFTIKVNGEKISKSGLKHRLNKIDEIAVEFKDE